MHPVMKPGSQSGSAGRNLYWLCNMCAGYELNDFDDLKMEQGIERICSHLEAFGLLARGNTLRVPHAEVLTQGHVTEFPKAKDGPFMHRCSLQVWKK